MTLKVGIIGMGAWGQKLVTSVRGSDSIRVVAGCTGTASKVADFAAEHDIALRADVAGLLADPEVEAVISTGPAGLHAEHSLAALRADRPVLAVKPLALRAKDARRLREVAGARGLLLALGYNRFFYPSNFELRRLVRAGEIGDVLHAQGAFCTPRFHTLPAEHWALQDANLLAGALADHPLYSMIELMGPVVRVDARATSRGTARPVIDTTGALLRFASGASATLVASGATAAYEQLMYFGSAGLVESSGHQLRYVSRAGESGVQQLDAGEPERAQLECFADAVRGRAAFPIPVDDAVHGVEVLAAMDRSARQDKTVSVP